MPEAPELSIIFGTYNRRQMLEHAVESIRSSVGALSYEIVITDGGSTDGSLEWMRDQRDIVIAGTNNLRGAVSAFNAAWVVSRGRYIANFNDDSVYVGQALENAHEQIAASSEIGQLALEFDIGGTGWHHANMPSVQSMTYANYGMSRREVVQRVCERQGGPRCYWNPIYHTYAGDCEHSAWVWSMGLRVEACGHRVSDSHVNDQLRRKNETLCWNVRHDDALFCRRWPDAQTVLAGRPKQP